MSSGGGKKSFSKAKKAVRGGKGSKGFKSLHGHKKGKEGINSKAGKSVSKLLTHKQI